MENSIVPPTFKLFILTSIVVPFGVTLRTPECPCGYGGICLNIEGLCHLCENISAGWYEKDCYTIVDHCAKKPCVNGRCVPTFGAYYCECPAHYTGINCQTYILENKGPSNKVSFYYQIQTRKTQRAKLFLLYEAEEWEFDEWELQWTIKVTDGREFYPTAFDFFYSNVYERCEKETVAHPEVYDARVCHLIPKHSVLTFVFDTFLSIPLIDREGLIFADGLTEPLGRQGKVSIALNARAGGKSHTLHEGEYTIFYYFHPSRIYSGCTVDFRFFDCSDRAKYPERLGRGELMEITAIRIQSTCQGTRVVKKAWYLQSLIAGEQDPLPLLLDGETHDTVTLPGFTMSNGLYMLLFEYTLQGFPPHYGSERIFTKIGHCWILADEGPLSIHLEGGDTQTASCLRPLRIPFINENPNSVLSEMKFLISCDHKDDHECKLTNSEVPVIKRKTPAPCGSVYTYEIVVYGLRAEQTIHAVITFVPLDVDLGIRCIQNCMPIDPVFKSIWVAYTLPYIQGSVNWNVTVSGMQFENKKLSVKSFYPAMATRIFVMRAKVFSDEVYSGKLMSVQVSRGKLNAMVETGIENVNSIVKLFVLERIKDEKGIRYRYKPTVDPGELNEYLRYRIFLINKPTLGAIWLVSTNYPNLLEFEPYWNLACLCIQTIDFIISCSQIHYVEINEEAAKPTNITVLTELFNLGQMGVSVRRADHLIWKSIVPTEPNNPLYRWRISVAERRVVVNLIRKVLSKHTAQVNLVTILHLFSMIFYSTEGNFHEGLPLYLEEFNNESDIFAATEWVQMRQEALMIMMTVAESIKYQSEVDQEQKRLQFPKGDFLERFMITYSLACAQATSYLGFTEQIETSDIFSGLIAYYSLMNHKVTVDIMKKFARSVANYMVLYDGVNKFGNNYGVLWSTNDSYVGLLYALNKSDPGEGLKFFGSNIPGFHWFNKISLQLPPAPYLLQYKEMTLTVFATKPHQFDLFVSCSLIILLGTRGDNYLKELPNNLKYRITLPIMKSGQFWNATKDLKRFTDVLEMGKDMNETSRKSKNFFFHAYKLTFPWKYEKFIFYIFQSEGIPIKAVVGVDQVPEYDDVMDSPDLILEPDEHFTFVSHVRIWPNPGAMTIPKTVYIGILPSKQLRAGGRINIFFVTTVLMCRTQDVDDKGIENQCQLVSAKAFWYENRMDCECQKFGLTGAFLKHLRIVRFLISDDPLHFDIAHHKSNYNFMVVCIETVVLVLLTAITLIVARIWDVKNRHQEHLIYTLDCFWSNTSFLAIGVYTGHRVGAGTMSSVAVQLSGQKSFSKVFLLKPTKSINRKTLQRGQDDWFVITTKEHIGKINAVHIWLNFHCISPWYCTEILIYDATTYQWFQAAVKRWFKIAESNDETRVMKCEVQEYQAFDSFDCFGFINTYITELKNLHQTFSIFKKHPRSLYMHEHRTSIFVIKVLITCCWTWITTEVLVYLISRHYMDAEASRGLVDFDERTFIIALFVSLMSSLSVVPLESLYRVGHLSRMVQKRTTKPLLFYLSRESRSSSRVSSFDARRQSRSSRQSRTSRPRSGRDPSLTTSIANVSFRSTKKVNYFSWTFFKAIYLSPCQFYWVNANIDTLNFTTRSVNAFTRLTVIFFVLVLFGAVMFVLWGTMYMSKAISSGFLVIVTLVVDALIVNPVLILIRTAVMFFVIHVSNKEELILNEETPFIHSNKISHSRYLSIATGKDYKPLLSSEIKKLKDREIRSRFALESLFFILIMTAAAYCMDISNKISDALIFHDIISMRELEADHEIKERNFVFHEKGIKAVSGPVSANSYISNNFLHMGRTWYSGKNISSNNDRWARNYNAQPIDATLTLFILLSNSTTPRVPHVFSKYYASAFGYFFGSTVQTEPVFMDRIQLHFTEVYSGLFQGKSGEFYKFKGYNVTGPTSGEHVARIRYTLEQLDTIINISPLRAMYVSVNFINGYTRNVITVDLLVEFHPSGICSASLIVNASIIEPRSPFSGEILVLIVICICMMLTIIASLRNSYLDDIWKKIVAFLTLVIILVVVYRDYKRTFEAVDKIKYNPVDAYLNLQLFHHKKLLSDLCLNIFPCLVLLHIIWIIRAFIGTSSFRMLLLTHFHYSFVFYWFGLVIAQVISICFYHDIGLMTAMINYCTKNVKLTDNLKNLGVSSFIFFVVVIYKIGFALIAYLYFYNETEFKLNEKSLLTRFIRTFNIHKPASILPKKKHTHRHDEMKRKLSPSRKDLKTKNLKDREYSPVDERPSVSQYKEKAYRPTSLLQKKIQLLDDNPKKT